MPQIWAESVEQHKRQTRMRIIEATVTLVARRGLGDVSMSQVAQHVGIGRATVYNYFPDIEQILLAWHDSEVERYSASLRDKLAACNDTQSRLRVFLTSLAAGFSGDHNQALDASRIELSALSPQVRSQMGEAAAKLRSLLAEILEQGIADHELRPDLDIPLTASLITRLASAARETTQTTDSTPEQTANAALALLFGGIQRPA